MPCDGVIILTIEPNILARDALDQRPSVQTDGSVEVYSNDSGTILQALVKWDKKSCVKTDEINNQQYFQPEFVYRGFNAYFGRVHILYVQLWPSEYLCSLKYQDMLCFSLQNEVFCINDCAFCRAD